METLTIETNKIKELFKEALIEAIEEKKDIVHDIFIEALEDIAMINAIREGEDSDSVSRNEVFNILEGNA